jgi:HEAT repeat protein
MSVEDNISNVVDELKYGHPETRKAAAIRLGRIRDKRVIPYLVNAMLTDTYLWTRISAIQSLTWIADQSIIEDVISVAKNDTEELVRRTAIETLGAFKNNMALDPLYDIIKDEGCPSELVRVASIAVEKIQGTTSDLSS